MNGNGSFSDAGKNSGRYIQEGVGSTQLNIKWANLGSSTGSKEATA